MMELTRVITSQITIIADVDVLEVEGILEKKDESAEFIKNKLGNQFSADDVTIQIQDFVRDDV